MKPITSALALCFAVSAFGASAGDTLPRRGVLGLGFTPLPDEIRTKLSIPAGQGLVATAPAPGLTAEAAGVQSGDVIVSINGKPVATGVVTEIIRNTPSGSKITLSGFRDGKKMEWSTNLQERKRDPGNANYEVRYDHIVSHGQKMRTIITIPKAPGKHPAMMFIQGFSPISYDYTLETATGDVATIDGPILYTVANSGYVTMRVEKPGVGDSEGGPFADLDFMTELDIYRQALKQLQAQSATDKDNVFIFGHSMGGSFGPLVAAENPVKGFAVYGTAGRTWMEYLYDILRYQGLLAGDTYEHVEDTVRNVGRIFSLALFENQSIADIKKAHPELAPWADGYMPGGLFNGKTMKFWAQLAQTNFAEAWVKLDCDVLAVHGASDYVTYDIDHTTIVDMVNRKKEGRAKFVKLPNSDHLFHGFATEKESMANFSKGKFNNDFSKLLIDWMKEVSAKKN